MIYMYLDYIKPRVCATTYECIKTIAKIFLETGEVNYSQSELAEMLGIYQELRLKV